MAKPPTKRFGRKFINWLLEENRNENEVHSNHPWWQVMCLTGVDYFSTLGYQPGIAALAAGAVSPLATLILVLLTLFGALPIYRRVAGRSPKGEGSIAMLEHLLPWWQGKLFVLCLLGFVATDFIITITLSAADATAHIIENPFVPSLLHNQQISITLFLVVLLAAVFLKGFREAIGIAVFLVVVYLLLNFIVISVGSYHILNQPSAIANWQTALFAEHHNPLSLLGIALLVFPKLALGLSGFETGVTVMPLVRGSNSDIPEEPKGRIRNTRKLLTAAAVLMSFFLIASSLITTILIPAAEFKPEGKANGRALAYLAHQYLGNGFGTIYDLSSICILWFAASLQRQNTAASQSRELLRQLGTTLLVQHKIVGRVEIIDKPELLWESPQLEKLYLRLEDEYEIRERHNALERKLELITQTAQTVLEFMQHSSSQRVEWYVVILIVVEIVLSLYEIFFKG
jgi:hypothetical protein